MIQLASGLLGALAATLALGAAHLENVAGNDLLGPKHLASATPSGMIQASVVNVNRTAKADRAGAPGQAQADFVTLSFRLTGLPDTSVMMRMPVGQMSAPPSPPAASAPGSVTTRRTIACEPAVSMLTTVAKQLQPVRCIT
ncbi:MAG: hypothetical protein J0G95_05060 [Rhizobiales bacterium]|nr:hypothetical protein [Hyphomicrobiales bacterium]